MNIIFLGKPFSGKGTQSKLIGERLGLPAVSIGHLLREAHKRDPLSTSSWWEIYTQGLNVPTNVKIPLLERKLDQATKGFILDNFPATQGDLEFLKGYLKKRAREIDRVFYLKINDETVQKRRQTVRGREDDEVTVVVKRLEKEFGNDLQPVLLYFKEKGVLEGVDGERGIDEVHEDIVSRLEKVE